MLEINSRDISTSEQKLLYMILQELQKLNENLSQKSDKKNKICKHCGKTHEKPIDYANCANKHKKEGAEDGK